MSVSLHGGAKPVARSAKAGLQFSVSRVESLMRKYLTRDMRLSKYAPVYMAGVLEYLAAELLELSGNAAKDQKRHTITVRDLSFAISRDQEFDKMFQAGKFGRAIPTGGVVPYIHSVLFPKSKTTNKTSSKKTKSKKKN